MINMMAPISSDRRSKKSAERLCCGAKRSSAGDYPEESCTSCVLAAKRGCRSSCDAMQNSSMKSMEKESSSCWSTSPAPASNPVPSTAQPDEELQALLPFFTPSEVQMLGFLEMPPGVLRTECQRCRAREADGVAGDAEGCLCRVLAEDHYFRDARANLARQLRETARQRRAVHIATNGGPIQNGTGCFGLLNRQGNNGAAERDGGTWDWLTQVQTCLPSTLQQTPPLSPPLANSPPSPFSIQTATTNLGQQQATDAAFGVGGAVGVGGGMSQMGNCPQLLGQRSFSEQSPPQLQQQSQAPGHWGFPGSGHSLPTAPQFPVPQAYPGQQTYGQQSNYGQHSFGQQPNYQQANFGQVQQQSYMHPRNCPMQSSLQQPQQPQQPGHAANFGLSATGQCNGGGSGGGGSYMEQEQFMGTGQYASNQYGGLAVQTGGYSQPSQPTYNQTQFASPNGQMYSPQFSGSPNQCLIPQQIPSQQPQQQYFQAPQGPHGACPLGALCPTGPPFVPAAHAPPHVSFNPHVLCSPPQGHGSCTLCGVAGGGGGGGGGGSGYCCGAGAVPPPPGPLPPPSLPPALQQFSEVTAKAQVQGASAVALLRKMMSTLPRTDGVVAMNGEERMMGKEGWACGCSPLELSIKRCWRTAEGAMAACERIVSCAPLPSPVCPSPSAPAAKEGLLCLDVSVRDRRILLWPPGATPAAFACQGGCESSSSCLAAQPSLPTSAEASTQFPSPTNSDSPAAITTGRITTQLPPPVTLNFGPWMT